MINKNCPLPKKPSALINLALKDLEKVEKDPKYVVYMWDWHRPKMGSVCAVCFAGSVMAKTCDVPLNRAVNPWNFSEETARKLEALDSFRSGNIFGGLTDMDIDFPRDGTIPNSMGTIAYEIDPEGFKAQMRGLIKGLRKVGL